MRHLMFIWALFFLVSCGDDESALDSISDPEAPEGTTAPKQGWMVIPLSSPLKKKLGHQGFAINHAITFHSENEAASSFVLPPGGGYFAPSYTPPHLNTPSSYAAPALTPFNRILAFGANAPFTSGGGVLGAAPGGVFASFPTYGGVPGGGALPGAHVGPGANLGVNFGSGHYSPLSPGRTNVVYWPPYRRRYIAVPVSVTGDPRGANAYYQPRVLSSGEPHPVIVFVPTAFGHYLPIVTFRGTT